MEALRDEGTEAPLEPTISWDAEGLPIKGVVMPWRLPRPPDAPAPALRLPTEPIEGVVPARERRKYVEQLWRAMYSTSQIEEIVSARYGVAKRTVITDLIKIKRRYADDEGDPDTIRTRKSQMRSTLTDLIHESRATGDLTTARYAMDRLCKLDGLYAPTKVEIETKVNMIGLQIHTIVGALDDDGLKALEIVMGQLQAKGIATMPEPQQAAPLELADVIDVVTSDEDDDDDDD